jgi:hypothetical protein
MGALVFVTPHATVKTADCQNKNIGILFPALSRRFLLNLKGPENGFSGGVKSPWRAWRTWRGNLNKCRIFECRMANFGFKLLFAIEGAEIGSAG